MMKVGISACLLGEKVRYDGGHKLDHYLSDVLGGAVQWVALCPEVGCGLSVPREAMRLVGEPEAARMVTVRSGVELNAPMQRWIEGALATLAQEPLCGYIFKSKSPSCGMQGVKVYTDGAMPSRRGVGLFARAFMERFPLLPVEEEGRLHDEELRENFLVRIFTFERWRALRTQEVSARALFDFHAEHKYLLMAHSPTHLRQLGALIAGAEHMVSAAVLDSYGALLMDGLKRIATVKKNCNVLQHMMGYFKKQLSSDEKQELLDVVGQYAHELVPLVVPQTLIRHYVRQYDAAYLARQFYLHPHPAELMLRNRV